MKIHQMGMMYEEIMRARQITAILIRYGFGNFVKKSGMGRYMVKKSRYEKIEAIKEAERIRLALQDLGPAFVKFGQILADRPDLIPDDVRTELQKLQDNVAAMPDAEAKKIIEEELKKPITEVFKDFNEKHIAAASIAQAYTGTLLNGDKVVIKVQRRGIDKTIRRDVRLMGFFANYIQKNDEDLKGLNIPGIVEEFGRSILKELDFSNEAANMMRFKHITKHNTDIETPKVYMEYTTPKVLFEEFVDGDKIAGPEALRAKGYDPEIIAKNGARSVFEQIFIHGFFHADPHPGNIFLKPGNKIVFIDYGMMGSLRPYQMDFLGKYVLGYVQRDARKITEAMLLLCNMRHFNRAEELEFEIGDLLKHYQFLSVKDMNFGAIMNQSIDIITRFGLQIPPTIYLLIKALVTIEGVAEKLYPDIDIPKEMEPFAKELLKQQFKPDKVARQAYRSIVDYYEFIRALPSQANEILYKIKNGSIQGQIEHKGLEPVMHHIDSASNRIAISIVTAALIIGGSLIAQWEHAKVFGSVIFLGAGFFGFWVLIKLLRRFK